MKLSECCGAPLLGEVDQICSECREHSEAIQMKLSDYTVKEIKSAMIHADIRHLDVLKELMDNGGEGVSTTMISMIVNGKNTSRDERVEDAIVRLCADELEQQKSLR